MTGGRTPKVRWPTECWMGVLNPLTHGQLTWDVREGMPEYALPLMCFLCSC